jgi:hypothetical protein
MVAHAAQRSRLHNHAHAFLPHAGILFAALLWAGGVGVLGCWGSCWMDPDLTWTLNARTGGALAGALARDPARTHA